MAGPWWSNDNVGDIPPWTRSKTVYVTEDQIKALNTTVVEVVPAEAGFFHNPMTAHVYREPGTVYTANGATSLQIKLTNSSGSTVFHLFDLTILTDSSVAATGGAYLCHGPTNSGVNFTGVDPTSRAGQNFVIFAAGGNPTVGTGGLWVTCWFQRFPSGKL